LKNFTTKAQHDQGRRSKLVTFASEKVHFNQSVDVPYVLKQATYLKNATQMHQLFVALYKKKDGTIGTSHQKQLKFVVRVTHNQEGALDEEMHTRIVAKLQRLESLII
jgi:hypothetical protein